MAYAGLDLGTTYSACYVYDDAAKKKFFLKFDNHALDFFPTQIAYHKTKENVKYIGMAAKRYRYSKNYDTYHTFKLSLGTDAQEAKGRSKTPYQVTSDFVDMMLKKLEEVHGIHRQNLVLVQSVPDVWKNEENNRVAMDNLADMYTELGMKGHIGFESEPVAAAVYYFNEICKGKYQGHIVVIDYGGGTLDLTLCRAEANGVISVLGSCGNGGDDSKGCAGSAFDQAVTRRLVEQYQLDEELYAPGMPAFLSLQESFENSKIASTENTRAELKEYYQSGGLIDSVVFTVPMPPPECEEYEVSASTIASAFEEVNQQALIQAVEEMKKKCTDLGINTNAIEDFRVLMVGGFSNLHCVENCVRELFGSSEGIDDPRFDGRMNREARSVAIAQGACLVAAGITPVNYINQMEAGFYAFSPQQNKSIAVPLLEKGKPVNDYSNPNFAHYSFRVAFDTAPASLELFFDDGRGRVKVRMDEQFRTLCPNYGEDGGVYQIGFSIDHHRIPQLHIRETGSQQENVVSLYKTMAKLPAIMIETEDEEHKE